MTELLKEYFATTRGLVRDASSLWKYAIGGLIALAIGAVGGKEYFRSLEGNTKESAKD
ncbi:hypothetical protein [Pseudanabaena sp. PCC 6802]|uniref:hypothetical protein n=1 Tax=Pseudanabaena sp. PCC 6802 TaxID=118173 RepID=UPI000344FCC6|nr:hypothetical protein [Pseudanabaena sp. PCC 6802]